MSRVPAEQRREQLIEATIQLAVRQGLAEASVRNIAEEANVSLGVVHYCFNSKEALLKAVAESFVTPIIGPVTDAMGKVQTSDVRTSLHTALMVFADVMLADRGRQLLGYELMAWSIRGEGDAAQSLHEAYLQVIETYLKDGLGLKEGDLPYSLDGLCRMLLAALDGMTLGWLIDQDTERVHQMIGDFATAFASLVSGTTSPASWPMDQSGRDNQDHAGNVDLHPGGLGAHAEPSGNHSGHVTSGSALRGDISAVTGAQHVHHQDSQS